MQPRRFVDEAGWTWQVIEVACKAAEDASKAVLYFMSRNGTRRLDRRQVSGDWEHLSAQELCALRDRAVLV